MVYHSMIAHKMLWNDLYLSRKPKPTIINSMQDYISNTTFKYYTFLAADSLPYMYVYSSNFGVF